MIKINKPELASFLLRLGLALMFLYAAIASFYNPESWIGFMPQFLRSLLPQAVLLGGFSIYELALSAWLLSNRKAFYSSMLAALTLLGIVIFNFGALEIIFRDIGLFLAAISLMLLEWKNR